MKTSVLLSALALLVSSALSNAAVIQCGVGERTAFIGEVDDSTVCETGSKNPKADDINVYFGGDWSIVAELEGGDGQTGFIGNSLFSADVTHGSWGNAPVGGTFSIGSDFWNTNDSAVLSMHIGNGGGEPDHFAWGLITESTFSDGIFGVGFEWDGVSMDKSFASYDGKGIRGAGFSNFKLWGDGVPVPEPSLFALFGIGLIGLGVARRNRKV